MQFPQDPASLWIQPSQPPPDAHISQIRVLFSRHAPQMFKMALFRSDAIGLSMLKAAVHKPMGDVTAVTPIIYTVYEWTRQQKKQKTV